MSIRGPYAKGVAKREEILSQALAVIGREGMGRASIRQLADAVGLSQAGLLHYFDSKEELFTAILATRDEIDQVAVGMLDAQDLDALRSRFGAIARHNSEVPGVVELFSRVAVDAADGAHPAREYFVARGEGIRGTIAASVAAAQASGAADDRLAPEAIARLTQAVFDGLQLQWLHDPSIDMADLLDQFFILIEGPPTEHGDG